jgi:aerobic carbon-monoxide dehydrogenase small subunit
MTIEARFVLNGSERTVHAPVDRRLIDVLRDDIGMTSAKKPCGVGRCGGCMVLVDGMPANSCLLMMWQIAGAEIVTPEGLDVVAEAAHVRQGLAEENAFQCGYCAPGFTVMLTALLRDGAQPNEQEIRAALAGNLCRCTGYHSIIRGALRAVALKAAEEQERQPDGII